MAQTKAFPDGFVWGTATAAHQIEGGNVNNDWWAFEHDPDSGVEEPSGDACDSWNRWGEDLDLVKGLGLGAYRFSLEWSRIEPAEGEYSRVALDHYRAICEGALARGLKPVVTFHHFTTPLWLARRGGFEALDAPERFAEFCAVATSHLGDVIDMACTINEPNMVAFGGYRMGTFPPGVSDGRRFRAVNDAFVRAHRLAVDAIRSGPGSFPVGLTLSMAEMVALEGGEARRDRALEVLEDVYLRATAGDDFLGVQCYTRMAFDEAGMVLPAPEVRTTQMGYEFWPECTGATLRRAAEMTGLPLYMTENGIGTSNDAERIEYLGRAIASVHDAISDGIDVRGYFCWSLLDNFEWAYGYRPMFGLFTVDRTTFAREPKPSAAYFATIAKANALSL